MKKRVKLLLALLVACVTGAFAQFDADKTYVISNRNDANVFMQDNGTGVVAVGAFNGNSYWKFEATANANCYYVKNAVTGRYMQSTASNAVEVATGNTPVEIHILLCTEEGDGMYGFASTDQGTHNFTDGTIGANWKDNGTVQGYAAVKGTNHRSFWKIVEQAMPQPIQGLSSPYAGVAPAVGSEYYLYNVKTGKWMGDNHTNTNEGWTSHGELGPRGRDIELKAGNADGRFQLNPKLSNNESINGSNLYMDTTDGVTNWIFTPVDVEGVTNCYALTTPGGKAMGANANGWATSDPNAIAENGNIWQLVSREQRLAAMQIGDDCSWLVWGGTFPVADSHRNQTTHNTWKGTYGDNANGGDGFYHCNRVWEFWNITNRDIYQDINVPNGKFKFKAQAIYVSTGGSDMNADRYNEYVADPTGNTKGVVYANDATTPMINVYSLVANERVNDRNTKEISSGVWAYNGTNEFSTNIFEGKGWTDEVEVEVTNGKLRVGARVENASSAWMLIDNFTLTYAGEVVIQDLTPYITALNNMITEAENFNGETTEALAAELAAALDAAKNVSQTDADAMTSATNALEAALNKAKEVDVKVLKATIALAEAEGITIPTSVSDYLANGTSNEIEVNLRLLRNLRKLNAIDKVDISLIECSEPANEEADYYLYNVGAGIFFSTTADWGTHIALDNPGMLIHFRPDGEWSGAQGRPVFHLSGNGWNGMNWEEEYWDKNGENKLAFVPVEGKEKVYHMCEWDNYNWHFVYDPADDVCDQNTHYWNTVQKRNWNVDDYKNNPYAQWMLVSPAAYKAAMANASEAKPLDVSHLINNPNFSKAKVDGNDNWVRGWTGIGSQMRGENREPWMVIEWFEANANMKQTIEGLRPGMYKLSVNGFYRDGSTDNEVAKVASSQALIQNASLVAYTNEDNKVTSLLPNVTSEAGKMPGVGETRDGVTGEFVIWPWQANEYFQTGLYKTTTPIINVGSNGQLTIGIESTYNEETGSWIVVDNFRLTYLGESPYQTMSIVGDFTGGWPNGDDWSMAKHMVQDAENPNIWTYVIEDFYAEGRKYEYKAAANNSWDGYKLPDGLANADFVFGTEGYPAGHYRLVFTVNISTNELSLDVQKPTVTISENANYVAAATEDALILLNRSFANEGAWNTFVVPFAISNAELKRAFGDDVEVAKYSENSDDANNVTVSFWTMDEPAITANTPVLLKTKTTETNFLFKSDIIEDMPVAEGKNFNLVGSYAALMTIAKGDYFLNDHTLYKSAGATTMKGTRAYLQAKNANNARIANIVFDDEEGVVTGITEIATEKASERIYNLSGQKVNAMQRKGLYIKDGKKVMK